MPAVGRFREYSKNAGIQLFNFFKCIVFGFAKTKKPSILLNIEGFLVLRILFT
jgi:hypothetical protein